jgi:glucose-1-phosphate thymidylyltransferase
MFLTKYIKLWLIAIVLCAMVLMLALTPFLILSPAGPISKELIRSLFGTGEFFIAVFMLNEFFRLQIMIRKEEIESKMKAHIESGLKKLHFKKSETGMKGIVLAGGTATRLFPLTTTTSKQLLPVYDKQMIFYPLNTLIKAGIKDILIIVAPEHSGQFINLLGSIFKKHGINLYFEVQKAPRGLSDAFILGENFIGEDNVTLILGDNIFEDDVSSLIANFKSGGAICAKKVADPERSGVVKFDEKGKAIQIVEKPKTWISDYAIPGLYVYDKEVVEVAKNLKPSDRGELEITDLHRHYLEKGALQVSVLEGAWLDAGTMDSLLEAGQVVKDKKISEKFHPTVLSAIEEFNEEMKFKTKEMLKLHNIFREEQFLK